MDFARQKMQRLGHVDLSRKGSVDGALKETVDLINSMPQYFSTSSCSGRIILFENVTESKVQKKGCKWLHVSHDLVHVTDIVSNMKELKGEAVFKFEPMVMHMQCQTLEDAQLMHQAAVAAGFRNSGITVGNKGKIMMAVRGTHSLEAPLSCKGQILVSQEYLEYLTETANSKMTENFARIQRFYENIKLHQNKVSSMDFLVDKRQKKHLAKEHSHTLQETDVNLSQPQKDDTSLSEDPLSLFIFD